MKHFFTVDIFCCRVLCAILGILMIGGSIIDVVETWSHENELTLSVQSGDIEPLLANSDDGHQAVNGGPRIQPLHQMQTGWRRVLSQVLCEFCAFVATVIHTFSVGFECQIFTLFNGILAVV